MSWRKPRTIFVNSMSDLSHEDVPDEFVHKVFEVMGQAHWRRFQVLTKRPERLLALDPDLAWRPHIWMGVSVENDRCVPRADLLRQTRTLTPPSACHNTHPALSFAGLLPSPQCN